MYTSYGTSSQSLTEPLTHPSHLDLPSTAASTQGPPVLDGLRVLVVACDAEFRKITADRLARHGAQVITVGTPDEALDALRRAQPDILIHSVESSDEDPFALMLRVRMLEMELGKPIPAVALTAHPSPRESRRAFTAGYKIYMPRTASMKDLTTTLAILAGRTGYFRKLRAQCA